MTGRYIEVELSDGSFMPAYFAEGSGEESRAGIIVFQEIFGVNSNMRLTAESFAALGYDTIVPDLFWRQEPRVELDPATDYARATELMQGLDQRQAVEDALAAGRYLRELDRSNGKTGAVGYCMGGKLAFLAAMETQLAASVSYYGVAIEGVLDRAEALRAPMLIHIGESDALCPPEAQRAIHQALDGKPNVEIIDHPGVGHAFARLGGAAFDERAAARANDATAEFLARHLS